MRKILLFKIIKRLVLFLVVLAHISMPFNTIDSAYTSLLRDRFGLIILLLTRF